MTGVDYRAPSRRFKGDDFVVGGQFERSRPSGVGGRRGSCGLLGAGPVYEVKSK